MADWKSSSPFLLPFGTLGAISGHRPKPKLYGRGRPARLLHRIHTKAINILQTDDKSIKTGHLMYFRFSRFRPSLDASSLLLNVLTTLYLT